MSDVSGERFEPFAVVLNNGDRDMTSLAGTTVAHDSAFSFVRTAHNFALIAVTDDACQIARHYCHSIRVALGIGEGLALTGADQPAQDCRPGPPQ